MTSVTGCDVVTSAFISDESRVAIRDHHHRCPPSYELDVDHPFPYLRMSSDASTGRDTRSFQYVLRSGFAGGVAGCVVSFGSSQWLKSRLLMSSQRHIGQDCRCSSRQSQDPIPSFQSGLSEICRYVIHRSGSCTTRLWTLKNSGIGILRDLERRIQSYDRDL